jgi:two-component system sensor histidine kinase TctE
MSGAEVVAVAPGESQRVFGRYYRSDDRDSDGCGLGLAIVREFTTRLCGRVSLRTPDSGRGIAVDVHLPPHSGAGM